MKVVAFNGSPKKNGNTAGIINIVAAELKAVGIEVEVITIGNKTIRGCTGCMGCAKNRDKKCVLTGDPVNEWIEKMDQADGILLGSPVYFVGVNGTMKSFLDRAFFVSSVNGNMMRHKVGASVAAVRRTGGIPTVNTLNNYFSFSEMMIPSANYWNVVHGRLPREIEQDNEGVQIAQVLGKNMAYLMQLIAAGKESVSAPEQEPKVMTNFVR